MTRERTKSAVRIDRIEQILQSPELVEPEQRHGLTRLFPVEDIIDAAVRTAQRSRELETRVADLQQEAEKRAQDEDRHKLHGQVYVSGVIPRNGQPAKIKIRELRSGGLIQKELPVDDSFVPKPFQIADVKDGVPVWTNDQFQPNCVPARFLGWVPESEFPRAWVAPYTPQSLLDQEGPEGVLSSVASTAHPPTQVDCPTLDRNAVMPDETILDVDFKHEVCAGLSTFPSPPVRQEPADPSGPLLKDVAMVELVLDDLLALLDPRRRTLFQSAGILPRALLIHGEQGTGKSTLLNALANTARLPEYLGPGASIYLGCASQLLSPWVGGSEHNIAEAFNHDLVLIDEGGSLIMRRDLRPNVYAGAHQRSATETVLSAISGAIADHHCRHPRPGRKLADPIVVFTLNTFQDEVAANFDAAVLDRFKFVKFSPFVSGDTYARYAAKLLDTHLAARGSTATPLLKERCLDYLLGDRLLATVRLAPSGNVDAAHAEETVGVCYRHVFTGRRLVAVSHETRMRPLRRCLAGADTSAVDRPEATFEDFKAALDAEARAIQGLLRRAEDLPEHAPSRFTRDMVARVKRIEMARID